MMLTDNSCHISSSKGLIHTEDVGEIGALNCKDLSADVPTAVSRAIVPCL